MALSMPERALKEAFLRSAAIAVLSPFVLDQVLQGRGACLVWPYPELGSANYRLFELMADWTWVELLSSPSQPSCSFILTQIGVDVVVHEHAKFE